MIMSLRFRLKAIRDKASAIDYATKLGLERGIKQGIKQGEIKKFKEIERVKKENK